MSARKANRAATLLASGFRQFQQGQVEQARQSCDQALELAPRHPDALHLRGVIALHSGDHARAVDWLQRAVALRPDNPEYLANLAYGCVGLKRLPDALAAFERAAQLAPGDPELQLGLGNCLGMLGKAVEAEAVLRRLVERHPSFAHGWFNLAKALDDQKRHEEARDLYRHVTQLAPQFAAAYINLGVVLNRLERYEEAEQAYRRCLAIDPALDSARVGLAVVLNSLRRHEEAEAQCREAIRRSPGERGARGALGNSLSGQGRWIEALRWFEDAVREEPEDPDLLGYLGDALARNGRTAEALEAFDRAVLHGADSSALRSVPFGRALTLFSAGRIREGTVAWFSRDKRRAFSVNHPDRPLADALPHDLRGRDVCVVGEQGLGDELFFLRYAPLLKARGCRVIYHGSGKITSMLARCAALDLASPGIDSRAAADFTLLVGDLPYLLDTRLETSPLSARAAVAGAHPGESALVAGIASRRRIFWPELPPPLPLPPVPEHVASVTERLRRVGPAPYIGLTWRAGTAPQDQRGRILQLFKEVPHAQLTAALGRVKGTLISLQRNPGAGETERLGAFLGRPLHDLSVLNEDLEEMLAALAVMDEYVCVSNTNTHLRASAGRTARVLVPAPAEWRWLNSGDESPWFPGFRIYRQKLDGDWGAELERLRDDLLAAYGSQ